MPKCANVAGNEGKLMPELQIKRSAQCTLRHLLAALDRAHGTKQRDMKSHSLSTAVLLIPSVLSKRKHFGQSPVKALPLSRVGKKQASDKYRFRRGIAAFRRDHDA